MHELSIAQAIVDAVADEASKAGATRVVSITLSLGELSGVMEDQLRFCFPFAIKDTLLETAELAIEVVPGEAFCERCNARFRLHTLLTPCPTCGAYSQNVLAGQELRIERLEVE